ncbi:AfsR/SARP family transcriptional regulator [Blastococcus deserti]|uniref:BTAD domain-containing putative transcriptional regulator n=1 Tax=Blastococcus deserti TaxID=2259033 RepID=A0ABW4X9F0_9ACTN
MDPATAPRITLLDGFSLRLGGSGPGTAVGVLPHGVQRLVAHLCLTERSARAAIAGHLWPDVPEEHAHGSLRSALWRLHKTVPGLIETSRNAMRLAPGVRVDIRELRDWARGALDPRLGADDVVVPPAELRGDLLPGWYDDWVLLERERLRQLLMHSLEAMAVKLTDAGRHGEALQVAYSAARLEPLRESAHRTVVRVHLAEGNVAEARRAYDLFRELLADELGVVPSDQMARMIPEIPRPRRSSRPAQGDGVG